MIINEMLVSWPRSRGNARGISYNWSCTLVVTSFSLPRIHFKTNYVFIWKNTVEVWKNVVMKLIGMIDTSGTNNFRINFLPI